MSTITAKLFKNGQNQAVRIPRIYEFKGINEVLIYKEGDTIIIKPKRKSWTSFADQTNTTSTDGFMNERPDIFDTERVKF